MKVIEIEHEGKLYQRYTNPPSDEPILVRWKWGTLKVYEKYNGEYWIGWKLSGRWMNTLKFSPCDEPEVEKIYKERYEKNT
jgi:hypothetical protein